jgi:hypothetical protein
MIDRIGRLRNVMATRQPLHRSASRKVGEQCGLERDRRMPRRRSMMFGAAALLTASPAAAQDYTTWGASHATNVGVTGAAERSARSASPRSTPIARSPAQAQACANRARFRAQYGPDHPKVRTLDTLCARAGY